MITFANKTTSIIETRKQIARKTLARKAPEQRGTLKPLWNIIPDGTITNYPPTTITLDTNTRKNTVIRKNDLAIVNETKPRLMHFVACKTVREYNRNQEKLKYFLLTEKKLAKQFKQRDQLDRPKNQPTETKPTFIRNLDHPTNSTSPDQTTETHLNENVNSNQQKDQQNPKATLTENQKKRL